MRSRAMAVALLLAASQSGGCGYNEIQRRDESVNAALGQIKVQLQRRFDLIPNLEAVVKRVAAQESTVFLGVAEARSRLGSALQSGSPPQMAEANAQLSGALGRLIAIAEAYPELKSNQNFLEFQSQLEGTENRISVARQDYNDKVRDFNTYIRTFPVNLTAKVTGAGKSREYYESAREAEQAPKVFK